MGTPKMRNATLFFLLAVVLVANLSFGLPRLSTYSAVDEPYWFYGRITKFWDSVAAHKWKSTSVNDKPGITVAIISGAGLFKTNPMDFKDIRSNPKTLEQSEAIMRSNFWLRIPIFLTGIMGILGFFFVLRRLFDDTIALTSAIFIGLSPILLGMSLIVNPDSLLWIFLPLALLSYLVFQKEGDRRYLISSGILLGLSLLTKYVANVFYVYLIGIVFLEYVFNNRSKRAILPYFKTAFLHYTAIVALSMATFFVLYPATWVNPERLLEGTFLSKAFISTWPLFAALIIFVLFDYFALKGKIMATISSFLDRYRMIIIRSTATIMLLCIAAVMLNTYLGMSWSDFEATLASPKAGDNVVMTLDRFNSDFFADFYALIFGLTPLTLFGFLAALGFSVFHTGKEPKREYVIVFYLSLFILLYYIGATVNHVGATVRYQIVLYPMACIIAAIGFSELFHLDRFKRYGQSLLIPTILIAISCLSLNAVKPFYLSYSSSLLPERYILNLKDMGDGSFEAAQYLNSIPNAGSLSIWSDKGAVCETFLGDCTTGLTPNRWRNKHFDYFVTSTGRKSKSLKSSGYINNIVDIKKMYDTDTYDFKLEIAHKPNNSIKVIEAGKVLK